MTPRKTSSTFKLSALAIAAAAFIVPLAHSVDGNVVVDKVGAAARVAKAASTQEDSYDRFIVTYRTGDQFASARTKSGRANMLAKASADLDLEIRPLRTMGTGAEVIFTERKLDLAESKQMMVELLKDPSVLAVEPDIKLHPNFVPNDPLYAQQWHYKNGPGGVNLEPAWDINKGAGTVVAVIDTGITPHSEFAGQLVPGYDFIADLPTAVDGDGRDADPNDPGDWSLAGECGFFAEDSSWHGTHVAGTIAALTNNGAGVAGVAPEAKVLPIRGLGKCGGFLSDIADGVVWASGGTVAGVPANANPAEVINMSLGGGGACSVAFQTAIDSAVSRGSTVVVAAGNSGGDAATQQPASCNNVIAVAAVGPTGAKAGYSSFGPVVDVAAPGGTNAAPATDNVLSTLNLGTTVQAAQGYAWYSGTSMASPHVAGIAALIQSASTTPKTPAQVKKIIENTAYANGGFPAGCSYAAPCGAGIADATAAVRVANGTDPLPADPPPPPPPPPAIELSNGVTVTGITVPRNEWVRYELIVPNGASNLFFAMYGGTGDADVYVRYGNEPTQTLYDCRPFSFGNNENCFFPTPRGGKWYVYIRGFSAATGVSLYPSYVDANYPYKEAATVTQLSNHRTQVALSWKNGKKDVDIYRNGQIYNTRRNRGTFTDNFRIVGTGTMAYKICNQGTQECSDEVSITYTSARTPSPTATPTTFGYASATRARSSAEVLKTQSDTALGAARNIR
jgi:serine protease